MTQDQFYNWLENPALMNSESIPQLREIVKHYPYFQAAQMMLAKNLRSENHIDQLNQLQLAAVMVPDRKVFHDYLNDKKPVQQASEAEVAVVDEPIVIDLPKETAEEVLEEPESAERTDLYDLIPEPIVYQLETADLPELETTTVEPEIDEISEDAELSFSQWLEYTEKEKTDAIADKKPGLKVKRKEKPESNVALIDHFLQQQSSNPPKRAEFFNPQKVAAKSQEEDFTVVSETLAKIYAQQEKYDLATQAYNALSLKYPEKSVYFAARLKEIDEKLNSE